MNSSGPKFSAIIVDDNREMGDLLGRMLSSMGGGISCFRSGEAALAALDATRPDLAIVDYKMSPMDGLGFTRALRESDLSWKRILPVIMITGHVNPLLIAKARDAGVNDFLAKPISPTVLRVRTEQVLQRSGRPDTAMG